MAEKQDSLLAYLLTRFHQGSRVAMAKKLGISRTRFSNYLHKQRTYNKPFILLLWETYGAPNKPDGIASERFLNLLYEKGKYETPTDSSTAS